MLRSIVANGCILEEFLNRKDRKINIENFSKVEWDKFTRTCEVLGVFNEATVMLGGEKYVSISSILPITSSLLRFMNVEDELDNHFIKNIKNGIKSEFKKRLANYNSIVFLKISMALDPRFKKFNCLLKEEREDVWLFLRNVLEADYDALVVENEISENEIKKTNACFYDLNRKKFSSKVGASKLLEFYDESSDDVQIDILSTIVSEINEYRKESRIELDADPLVWWCEKACKYPHLATCTKILSIPATSIPC
jgi:hypothetical protein